jgi:alkylation response protein AidB-like acyl-CoA dehydrogenase
MDLAFTKDDLAFRDEVRGFIRDNLPAEIKRKVENGLHTTKQDHIAWQKILHKRGWMGTNWPKKYGGTGWNITQRFIFDEEIANGSAPNVIPFGPKMVAPVIWTFGSEAQKQRFLPRILATDDMWVQGYSEPGSGSDLASLRTKAERQGDHYIVNGQKTWTTVGHWGDWIFCLVRTDPKAKQQEGISFLLIDMKSPGIEVHPIITIDGGHEVNSVFFTDVKVPAENLVGEENKGWTYAKFLLGYERSGTAAISRSKKQVVKLKAIAKAELDGGRPLIDQPAFRENLAALEIVILALQYSELRSLSAMSAGQAPGPEVSLQKVKGTEIQQRITELMLEAIGYYANPYSQEWLSAGWNEPPIGPDYAAPIAPRYFNVRKTSIYGGSNEIQRNIIAKMVLGL